ncbi:MAG TPA: PA2779 family protein [Bryobacteraceae bacterium]|nr:PA2779 family protein [Bryobacteraceae bacterium]
MRILMVASLAGSLFVSGVQASQSHVVSPVELRKEVRSASESREQNLSKVQEFLSSDAARKALASAHVDQAKVGRAVAMLSDEELARLNAQVSQIQSDFAAGELTTMQVTLIILGVILVAVVIAIAAA